MTAYYNEIDPKAAAWLQELINMGEIPDGDVDTRDIRDVLPSDLGGYAECHFFAGIGVWARAKRDAGLNVLSARQAKEKGLMTSGIYGRPGSTSSRSAALASSLANKLRQKDAGYAASALDLCAAGFGAPHIRQRLYFAALADGAPVGELVDSLSARPQRQRGYGDRGGEPGRIEENAPRSIAETCGARIVANTNGGDASAERKQCGGQQRLQPEGCGRHVMADAESRGQRELRRTPRRAGQPHSGNQGPRRIDRPGPVNGFWRDADWLRCRDDKWRPVKPGSFPLAHGIAGRVGLLRGAGNAIVLPQATAFLEALDETIKEGVTA